MTPVDMTYRTQVARLFDDIDEYRSRANFALSDEARDKILVIVDLLERENREHEERLRWQNECFTDLRIRADNLAAALRPYLDEAAPHEHLFSGADLRNFQRAESAISAYQVTA